VRPFHVTKPIRLQLVIAGLKNNILSQGVDIEVAIVETDRAIAAGDFYSVKRFVKGDGAADEAAVAVGVVGCSFCGGLGSHIDEREEAEVKEGQIYYILMSALVATLRYEDVREAETNTEGKRP